MTPKQVAFVREFLIDRNASAAARRAGYTGPVNVTAHRLLKQPEIRKAVNAGTAKLAAKADLSAEWVLRELMANVEAARPDDIGASNRALELLGKHLVLFPDRQEHSGPAGGPFEVKIIHEIVDPGAA